MERVGVGRARGDVGILTHRAVPDPLASDLVVNAEKICSVVKLLA